MERAREMAFIYRIRVHRRLRLAEIDVLNVRPQPFFKCTRTHSRTLRACERASEPARLRYLQTKCARHPPLSNQPIAFLSHTVLALVEQQVKISIRFK